MMASFDMDPLFKNIFFQEKMNICIENLLKDRTYSDKLLKDSFRELLSTTMSESLILFNQEFYKQHDGVAMGSPLGPTLTNIFVIITEKLCFKIALLNLNLLPIECALMIHSYFFAGNMASKNSST